MVQHRAHSGPGLGAGHVVRPALPWPRRHAALRGSLPSDLVRCRALGRMEEGGGHPVDAENAAAFPRPFAHRVPPLHARAIAPTLTSRVGDEGGLYIKKTPLPVVWVSNRR